MVETKIPDGLKIVKVPTEVDIEKTMNALQFDISRVYMKEHRETKIGDLTKYLESNPSQGKESGGFTADTIVDAYIKNDETILQKLVPELITYLYSMVTVDISRTLFKINPDCELVKIGPYYFLVCTQ